MGLPSGCLFRKGILPVNRLIPIIMVSVVMSCAYYSPIYWGYGEWAGSESLSAAEDSIAGFEWYKRPGVITSIDGKSVGEGYKKAKLFPGRHVIEYADHPAAFGGHPKGIIEIDVKAGHQYAFNIKYCFWCKPRRYAVWIEDTTISEVVWGSRPDWPFWYL